MSIFLKMEPTEQPLLLAKEEMTDSKESRLTCSSSQIESRIGLHEEIPLKNVPTSSVGEGPDTDEKEKVVIDQKADQVDSPGGIAGLAITAVSELLDELVDMRKRASSSGKESAQDAGGVAVTDSSKSGATNQKEKLIATIFKWGKICVWLFVLLLILKVMFFGGAGFEILNEIVSSAVTTPGGLALNSISNTEIKDTRGGRENREQLEELGLAVRLAKIIRSLEEVDSPKQQLPYSITTTSVEDYKIQESHRKDNQNKILD